MLHKRLFVLLTLLLLTALSGCATTGPDIPKEDLVAMEEEIEALAAERYVEYWARTWQVGYKVLKALPGDELKNKTGIGALIADNSEKIARAFHRFDKDAGAFELPTEDGCVVIAVGEDGPADLAGLMPGDVIKIIDGEDIEGCSDVEFEVGKPVRVVVERGDKKMAFDVTPEEIPYAKIRLKETDKVNAYAKFTGIEFTSGMLSFAEDDDELAVIMGHEMAHLVKHHLLKNMAVAAMCGGVGGLTGPFAFWTTQALYAPYSRQTEREADYFGLVYSHWAGYDIEKGVALWKRFALEIPKSRSKSFLRSHPASPERILRVKKVAEMLKSGTDPQEILKLADK
ncbi:MAG: M48 family metalloprotease, partial [Candidatus Brocadiales bacterium]